MSNRLVGFLNRPTGRFGNHLYQYYFLHKIAKALESKTFHAGFLGKEQFEGFQTTWLNLATAVLKRKSFIDFQSNEHLNWQDFLSYLSNAQKKNHAVVLPTGKLDWFFYDDQPDDIAKIIKARNCALYGENNSQKSVGIHFRGGDFARLRPSWVLPQKYYEESIEYLSNYDKISNYKITLFTDDPTHPTVANLLKRHEVVLDTSRNDQDSFQTMSCSDILISSNSTFSYWGGVLGKKKKVIYSKEWIDKEINNGDKFWLPVREKRCNFLKDFVEV